MIEAWVTQRSLRFLLAGSVLAAGFAAALILILRGNFTIALVIFPVSLAALVGAGKLASP